mgnify:CR=1 FL=1
MNTEDALTPGDKEVMLQGWSESVKDQLAEGIHKDEIILQILATGLEYDAVAEICRRFGSGVARPLRGAKGPR